MGSLMGYRKVVFDRVGNVLIPDDEDDDVASNVRLPGPMWEKLDEIATIETEERKLAGKRGVVSRAKVIRHGLQYFINNWEKIRAAEELEKQEQSRPKKRH
jgi:hypothetical protein